MHVRNVLHMVRWKYRTQKSPKIRHLGTFAQLYRAISSQLRHVSTIGKKVLNSDTSPICHHDSLCEIRPANGWDPFGSLGHPNKFHRVSRLGSVTTRHSSGRQPNLAAWRHLYSARRSSRWALTHILVMVALC